MSTGEGLGAALRKRGRAVAFHPWVFPGYSSYRRWQQNSVIETEQREYEARATTLGLSHDWGPEEVAERLQTRLRSRGIAPTPKDEEGLRIVYATGYSEWDEVNILPSFKNFGEVFLYSLRDQGYDDRGEDWLAHRDAMNSDFVRFVRELHKRNPIDFVFTYFSGHTVGPDCIEALNSLGIITMTMHLDDRLLFRGRNLGGRWRGPAGVASAYDLNLTQAPESLVKYRVEGAIPLLWPLAANPALCFPRQQPFQHDVSFVGTAYGNRISLVRHLRNRGIPVKTLGQGWPEGYIPPDKFQEMFCASRINLNFDDIGYTYYQCGKLRDFEIPMCGALMLGTENPHLKKHFDVGTEIFQFSSPSDCVDKIRHLLGNPELCRTARERARARALAENTWDHRVQTLLKTIGLLR